MDDVQVISFLGLEMLESSPYKLNRLLVACFGSMYCRR